MAIIVRPEEFLHLSLYPTLELIITLCKFKLFNKMSIKLNEI
jgi:hypothetical protein